MSSYSVDSMKAVIFEDELINVLNLIDSSYQDEQFLAVQEYLQKRVNELKGLIETGVEYE